MVSPFRRLPCAMAAALCLLTASAAFSQTGPSIQPDSIQQIHCAGNADGAIYLSVTGGLPPYLYLWSNGSISEDIGGLGPGIYTCTVTDLLGSADTISITLANPPYPINPNISGPQAITCAAPAVTLESAVSDLLGGYEASWTSTGGGHFLSATDSLAVLVDAGGIYTLTVVHTASGCTASDDYFLGVDTLKPLVFAGIDQIWLCTNTGGTLNGSLSAGADFSFFWDASAGGLFSNGGVQSTHSTELNPEISHSGIFTLTGIDNFSGCSNTDAVTVNADFLAPDLTASATAFTCMEDTAYLSATFSPLNISFADWAGPGGFSAAGLEANTMQPGAYTVGILDTLTGCNNVVTVTVGFDTLPPVIQFPGNPGILSCTNPDIILTVNNDTLLQLKPYEFQWEGPAGYVAAGSSVEIDHPGLYTVEVRDTLSGCINSGAIYIPADSTFVWAFGGPDGLVDCYNPLIPLNGSSSSQGAQYLYLWTTVSGHINGNANTPVISVDAAGTYTLEVSNTLSGCSDVDEVLVAANQTEPQISVSASIITCAMPQGIVIAIADTTGLDYEWTGPNGFSAVSLQATVDIGGNYTFAATDTVNGCSASASVGVLTDTIAPLLSISGGNISCSAPTTTLSATVQGGNAGFSWSGPNGFSASTANADVSAGGTYTVTATGNANSCQSVDSISVDADLDLPVAVAGADDYLNCHVKSLKLNGSGSSTGPDIEYLWTTTDGHFVNGETKLSPRVDAPGVYVIAVTNTENGCVAYDTVVVIEQSDVTVTLGDFQQVNCFGEATGSVTATPAGGAGVYTFGWSDGSQSATASNLQAGSYTVVVVDSDGCSATAVAEITQPAQLKVNAMATAETFGGLNDGTASVLPGGGVGPWTVQWSSGQSSNLIINLAPGNYSATVTDALGCTAVETVTVNASNCFITATVSSTNVSCFGTANGSAVLTVSNAPDPVLYAWSNSSVEASISGLEPGVYTVTATDGNGCSVVRTVTITSPQALAAAIVVDQDVACVNSTDGYLAASANGGTPPYTFNWSNGASMALNLLLGTGIYTVTVADAHACSSVLSGEINATDVNPPLLYLQDLTISLDNQGEVNLQAEDFIQVGFDAECEIDSFSLVPDHFDCAQLGTHTVSITAVDVNGNTVIQTATVTINDNVFPLLNCPPDVTLGLCDAQFEFETPLVTDNCMVDQGLVVQSSGLVSGSLFPVGATLQTFTYTDISGNTGSCNFSVTIKPNPTKIEAILPAACAADCNGSASLVITSGTGPYAVNWDNGQAGLFATGLCPGDHAYSITDGLGCVTIYSFTVGEDDNILPTLVLAPAVAPLDSNGTVTINADIFDDGSFDNCGIASWSASQLTFGCSSIGIQTVLVTVADFNGNSVSSTVELAVVDLIPPVISCPADIVTGYCHALTVFDLPAFQDNCANTAASMTLTSGLAPGSEFPAGTTVQVYQATDNSGNSGTCSFSVTVAEAPAVSSAVNAPSCYGLCNGIAVITPLSGLMPFSYQWIDGQTGNIATGLCADGFFVTVTDANGCTGSPALIVVQPPALVSVTNNLTNDVDNLGIGSIDVTITGGVPPYQFSWTLNGSVIAGTEDVFDLHAGTYILIVTDFKGCTLTAEFVITNTVNTSEPPWAQNMRIYPNPASDYALLRFEKSVPGALSVSITDAGGRLVRDLRYDGAGAEIRIELADMPAGMWFVRLRSEEGGEVVRKLAIEK